MLTDKEIAELRVSVRRTWVPWVLCVLGLLLFFGAIARVYMVQVICERTGITWAQILQVVRSGPDFNTIYVGAELRAQSLLDMALFGLALSAILATAAVAAYRQRRKDLLLLEFIDRADRS
jgi:hypothetical protein